MTDKESTILTPCAEDLLRYRDGVETLIRLGARKAVSNGTTEHAAILFEMFFKHAKEHVRIFCKNLKADVFNSPALLREAGFALQGGKQITVIVQENPEPSEFRDMLEKSKSLFLASSPLQKLAMNFATMDCTSIRYEPNPKDVIATAWFNRPDIVRGLVHFFDLIATKAKPYPAA